MLMMHREVKSAGVMLGGKALVIGGEVICVADALLIHRE